MLKSKGGDKYNGHPVHQAPPFKSEKYVVLEISSAQIGYICLAHPTLSNYGAQRRLFKLDSKSGNNTSENGNSVIKSCESEHDAVQNPARILLITLSVIYGTCLSLS